MKSIFKLAACLSFASLLVYSCKMEDIDTQMTEEEAIAAIKLDCDALESYTIQALRPQAVSFTVTSTTPWTVTVSEGADWLSVSPASSAVSSLSEDVRLTATPNDGLTDRKATVTVKGENTSISYTIAVTQMRKGQLTVTPLTEEFALNGNAQSFSLQTNLPWEARSEDDWLTLSPASGDSDGSMKSFTVQATAAANKSIVRSTKITVTSGDEKQEFTVTQKGQSLEFLPVEDASIDRKGGELTLTVNATMDWKVECDNDAFTVTKTGTNQVKVAAGWNNKFAPRTAEITLKPVSADFGDVSYSATVSQDVNFKLDGNCEVLEDGSVKISSGAKSRVTTLDELRYVSIKLTMGEVNFGAKGELWCAVNAAGCNIYNQLSLGGNLRIRQDGTLPNAAQSTYKNVSLSGMDQDALNAMTEYRFEVLPDGKVDTSYSNVKWHYVRFWYNGTLNTEMNFRSVFEDDPTAAGAYWFGFYNTTSDGTWYIVKSCDIDIIAE